MERDDYSKRVREIINMIVPGVQLDDTISDDEPLTGNIIDVNSVDFVYIVLEIMSRFNVSFDAADFENYSFNSINGIVDALQRHLE